VINIKTTYVVSGFMRTGTSMMMKALEYGGLDAVYSPLRDNMNSDFGDEYYKPNPGGFYELTAKDYREPGFPRQFEGRLIKCLYGGLPRMVVGDYKVVFMMRDPEEIRQSYESFFNKPAPPILKQYDQVMGDSIAMLKNRKDTEVVVLQYRDVIENPHDCFCILKRNGWDIDVVKSASVVNPELYRYRIEELTVGI
jgi:hypothetical protein